MKIKHHLKTFCICNLQCFMSYRQELGPKEQSTFRKPLELAIALRHLASGNSYSSMKFGWRVSGAGTFFGIEGAENIKYKLRFAPKFVKHLHQPVISMGVGSCTFYSHLTWTRVWGRTGAILPCPCGHTMCFKKSDTFCTKKCKRSHLKNTLFVRKMSALDFLPDRGRLLWTAA